MEDHLQLGSGKRKRDQLLTTALSGDARAQVMARRVQVEHADAVYYETAQRHGPKAIFRDVADGLAFLKTLEQMVARFGVVSHSQDGGQGQRR